MNIKQPLQHQTAVVTGGSRGIGRATALALAATGAAIILIAQIGIVDDVANAVVFLTKPAARIIIGSSLLVDGGWIAY